MEKFDLKQITENKPLFFTIIAMVVVTFVFAICLLCLNGKVNSNKGIVAGADQSVMEEFNNSDSQQIDSDVELFTTENIGKAIEVQALLARNGIKARKSSTGSKVSIILSKSDKITKGQLDRALLTIVKSGLLDEHTGLEIFDKGDFTSTKDDKKIRLIRRYFD